MKVGILGANGFIGSSLCKKFVKLDQEVFAFYNCNKKNISKGCQAFSIDNLPDVTLDYLFISIGGHGLKHQDYISQYIYLEKILNKIKFINIIFISSVEVYGRNSNSINSKSYYDLPSIYGQSKLSQEFLIRSFENFLIIRPTYIYGLGMNQNSLIPIWSKVAREKNEIVVFGNGKRKQDYLFIDDLIDLCVLATTNKIINETIIAATGKSISNSKLAHEIAQNIPNTIINFKGVDNAHSSQFNIDETKQLYGWIPKISIKEGISNYLKNESFNI